MAGKQFSHLLVLRVRITRTHSRTYSLTLMHPVHVRFTNIHRYVIIVVMPSTQSCPCPPEEEQPLLGYRDGGNDGDNPMGAQDPDQKTKARDIESAPICDDSVRLLTQTLTSCLPHSLSLIGVFMHSRASLTKLAHTAYASSFAIHTNPPARLLTHVLTV